MKFIHYLSIAICLSLSACIDAPDVTPEPEEASLEIISTEYTDGIVTPEGGSYSIRFSCSKKWLATSSRDWCKLSVTSGKGGDNVLTVSLDPNDTYESREAEVLITCGDLTKSFIFTQAQKDAIILAATEYTVGPEESTISFEVQANIPLTVSISEDSREWISQVSTKAMSSEVLVFLIAANTMYDSRKGTITVSSGDIEQTITVVQAQKDALIIAEKEYNVGSESSTMSFEVQTNIPFTVSVSDDAAEWISPVTTKALTTETLMFQIAENSLYVAREGLITVRGVNLEQTVKVIQAQKDALIIASKEYKVGPEASTLSFEVQANVPLEVSFSNGAGEWISQVTTKSLTTETLVFMISENTFHDAREGGIIVSGGGLEQTVTVTQKGYPYINLPSSIDLAYKGGEVFVDIDSNCDEIVVTSDTQWVSFGSYDADVRLILSTETNGFEPRSARLFVRDGSGMLDPVIIEVTQDSHPDRTALKDFLLSMGYTEEDMFNFPTDWTEHGFVYVRIPGEENSGHWIVEPGLLSKSLWDNELDVKIDDNGRVSELSCGASSGIPASISSLSELTSLSLCDHVYGTLPKEIGSLQKLKSLTLQFSNISGEVPDVFGEMSSLEEVSFYMNHSLGGDVLGCLSRCRTIKRLSAIGRSFYGEIPESLGNNCPDLESLCLGEYWLLKSYSNYSGKLPASLAKCKKLTQIKLAWNEFTGNIPEEWCDGSVDRYIEVWGNYLRGQFPDGFYKLPHVKENFWKSCYQRGDGFIDVSNADNIPGDYPDATITDYAGRSFTYDEVFKKNKYTLEIFWATWCPYSAQLMPQLKKFYEAHHDDGFEIIAADPQDWPLTDEKTMEAANAIGEPYVKENGYDKWYNIVMTDESVPSHPMEVPIATVYDSNGSIVFCVDQWIDNRNRTRHDTFTDLIPFLVSKFGNY